MEIKQKTPIKAIRAFCVYCMGNQVKLVEGCTAPECPLFPFRNRKANRDTKVSPKQEEAYKKGKERLKAMHASKTAQEIIRETPSKTEDN